MKQSPEYAILLKALEEASNAYANAFTTQDNAAYAAMSVALEEPLLAAVRAANRVHRIVQLPLANSRKLFRCATAA